LKSIVLFERVTLKDKALIARQLATMLGSGLSIDQAFRVLSTQTRKNVLKRTYQTIIYDLEQGNTLSYSLSRQKKIFDPVFIAIVRAGESSGKIDVVLNQLAERLEMNEDFNSKVRAAMYYPAFIVCTMIVIVILMMVFVIPQLKMVFDESNIPLPWTTRLIIALSNFTVHYWYLDIIITTVLFLAGFLFFKSKEGGSFWDRMKIRLPVIKNLYELIYMSRFCRTMAMLMQSGVPIMETIAITADVIQNRIYTQTLRDVSAQVERGIPMSVPLSKDQNFPSMVPEMILVGEQTGKMGTVLTKLAEYYENETNTTLKGLAGIIEPSIIVIVGIGVGFLVFSIIYPIYSIAQIGF